MTFGGLLLSKITSWMIHVDSGLSCSGHVDVDIFRLVLYAWSNFKNRPSWLGVRNKVAGSPNKKEVRDGPSRSSTHAVSWPS
jgi:hypothetical protein